MSRLKNLLLREISLKWLMVGLLVATVVIGGFYVFNLANQEPLARNKPARQEKPKPTAQSAKSRMLIMGDMYFGRYINDWSMKSPLKYAYPFSKLDEFERGDYDAWIANLECPTTNNPKLSSAQENATLTFDCSPKYLAEARKWFDVVSLSNNHTDNQGAAGFAETQKHLAENKIQYFGTYDPEDRDNLCDVISVPAHITLSDNTKKEGDLPMVWCGYHGVFKTPTAESVAVIEKYAEYFPVIAVGHSGQEYKPTPDQTKTDLFRGFIDAGADAVIGGHPHWVQASEAYKGKLIMYSLGNFIFDQQASNEVTRSALLKITAQATIKDNPNLEDWLKLGEQCRGYHDSCLELAKQQKLAKLKLNYDFDIEGSDNSGKLVHKASSDQLRSIKDRLNWDTTLQNLK